MPSEPEISDPPAAVRAELAALADAIDPVVPAKRADRNLLIGTWNLRAFGGLTKRWQAQAKDSPKRNFRDVAFIAEIVSRFDVIAIQRSAATCARSDTCSRRSAPTGASCSPT